VRCARGEVTEDLRGGNAVSSEKLPSGSASSSARLCMRECACASGVGAGGRDGPLSLSCNPHMDREARGRDGAPAS
jgi:hypothetical protein